MSLWLLITAALTVQEGLSVLAVLLRAYQLHYSIWIISLIWLVVTTIQITIGYYLGRWVRKSFKSSRFEKWVEKYAHKLEKSIDKNGEKIGLILLSSIISPAVAGFVAPWLDISFGTVFLYALLGDLFWYASTWATVLGAEQILSGIKYGLLLLIAIAIVWVAFSHYRKNKTS
jgi:membrane protein YqaA with SNARE-associated domain